MKKTLITLLVLAVVVAGVWFLIRFQRGTQNLKKHIPAESGMVISIDLLSIHGKADLQHIGNRAVWKKLMEEADDAELLEPVIAEVLKDPQSSGIDFRQQAMVYVSSMKRTEEAGLLLGIQDPAAFQALVKKSIPDAPVVEERGTWRVSWEEDQTILLWSEDVAILLSGRSNAEQLKERAIELLFGEYESMADNPLFRQTELSGMDMQIYLNYSKLMAAKGMKEAYQKLGISGDFAFNLGLAFENGQLRIESNQAYEETKGSKLDELAVDASSGNKLSLLTSKAPTAAFQIHLDMESLIDLLMMDESSKANMTEMSKETGLSEKELRNLLSGDFSLCFGGVKKSIVNTNFLGFSQNKEVDRPMLSLFVGVKDQNVLKKVVDRLESEKQDGIYTLQFPFLGEFYYVIHPEGIVYFTDRESAVELAKSSKLGDGNFETVSDLFDNHGNAAYLELDTTRLDPSLLQFIREDTKAEYDGFGLMTAPFSHLTMWSVKQKGYGVLTMKREDQNAFIGLLDMLDQLVLWQEKMEAQEEAELDTLIIPPDQEEGYEEEQMYEIPEIN